MKNNHQKQCLSCRSFRLISVEKGICRVDKGIDYPEKAITDSCERYRDCGQQYYIRLGWISSQNRQDEPA